MLQQRLVDPRALGDRAGIPGALRAGVRRAGLEKASSLFVEGTARLFEAPGIADRTHVNELIDLLERHVALLQVLRAALSEPGMYVRMGRETELPAMHLVALVATG